MGAQSDDDFVDRVFCEISALSQKGGYSSLSVEEKRVLIAWHTDGVISNGGFQYFFEEGIPAQEAADAFAAIGLEDASAAILRAVSLFGKNGPSENRDDRVEQMRLLRGEGEQDPFKELNRRFWKSDEHLSSVLAEYIRRNTASIRTIHRAD